MNFRQWLQEMWYEHQTEILGMGQTIDYTAKDYFARYRWWLRREYRHQVKD